MACWHGVGVSGRVSYGVLLCGYAAEMGCSSLCEHVRILLTVNAPIKLSGGAGQLIHALTQPPDTYMR